MRLLRRRWYVVDTVGDLRPVGFWTKRGARLYRKAFLYWASDDRFSIVRDPS